MIGVSCLQSQPQYDDSIEPYLRLTKALYKDLVTVNKSAGGALQIGSLTFLVTDVAGSCASLFPRPSPHNFCYVVVDPLARHVKLWYAAVCVPAIRHRWDHRDVPSSYQARCDPRAQWYPMM